MEEDRDTFWKLFQSGGGHRMTSGMLDAFLDGFTGSGERVRLGGHPATHRQSMTALTCGFVASVVVMVGFGYLIIHHHPKTGYVLISTMFAGTIIRTVRIVRHGRRSRSLLEIDPGPEGETS